MIRIKFHPKHVETRKLWRSEISGIITSHSYFCITSNYSRPVSQYANNGVIPLLCLLRGSRDAVTGLDLVERAADVCLVSVGKRTQLRTISKQPQNFSCTSGTGNQSSISGQHKLSLSAEPILSAGLKSRQLSRFKHQSTREPSLSVLTC